MLFHHYPSKSYQTIHLLSFIIKYRFYILNFCSFFFLSLISLFFIRISTPICCILYTLLIPTRIIKNAAFEVLCYFYIPQNLYLKNKYANLREIKNLLDERGVIKHEQYCTERLAWGILKCNKYPNQTKRSTKPPTDRTSTTVDKTSSLTKLKKYKRK